MKRQKRNQLTHLGIALGLVATVSSVGCVDFESNDTAVTDSTTQKHAVTIVPQFQITGADALPDNLFLTELGLVVSEIRLSPVVSGKSGLAYTTRDPIALSFDIARNEFQLDGDTVVLPDAGRYVVSMRLEPVAALDGENEVSFVMGGFVADIPQPFDYSRTADGTPLPLPFDEKKKDDEVSDRSADPLVWTPFEYNSQRTVSYTFGVVEFAEGEQTLAFTFDIRDWAGAAADPISSAIRNGIESDNEEIDVTRQIESRGVGVDSLIQAGVVRSNPQVR